MKVCEGVAVVHPRCCPVMVELHPGRMAGSSQVDIQRQTTIGSHTLTFSQSWFAFCVYLHVSDQWMEGILVMWLQLYRRPADGTVTWNKAKQNKTKKPKQNTTIKPRGQQSKTRTRPVSGSALQKPTAPLEVAISPGLQTSWLCLNINLKQWRSRNVVPTRLTLTCSDGTGWS